MPSNPCPAEWLQLGLTLLETSLMPIESPDALPRRRWWLRPLLWTALIAVVAVAGFWIYRAGEPGRLCRQARAAMDRGDFPAAAIALKRAVTIAPSHAESVRLMAELTDRLGAASAVEWHEQVVALQPDSDAARLSLVGSAMRARRIEAAEHALAGATPAFRATAQFEALRGLVAIGKGHWREAEQAFAEAARREPRPSYRLNSALAQAQNPDAKVRDAGVAALRDLAKDPSVAASAQRSLTRILSRAGHLPEALQFSRKLVQSGAATFEDRLTCLDLAGRQDAAEYARLLEQTRAEAVKNPGDLAALLTWSVQRGLGRDARTWAASLDPALLENRHVVEAWAETIAATNDWPALAAFTARKLEWARGEVMRQAFAALAAEKAGSAESAGSFWQLAVHAAGEQRDQLMALAYFAHRAGWRARMIDVLWVAAGGDEGEWALRMLHRLLVEDGNTRGLLRVAQRLSALKPEDRAARNNVIVLSLLLDEPASEFLRSAQELHAAEPANVQVASTHAFALHKAGKTEEALEVMAKIPAAERKKVAAYDAAILQAAGRAAEAREAAEQARQGKLLPEEERLLPAK